MCLYKKAYFDGSIKDISNYVKIDSQGCIKLSEIQKIYNNNNFRVINKLKGHLLCPKCKRARLFYRRVNLNSNTGYLQKLPTSQHSKGCCKDRPNKSRKHYFFKKYNNINSKNASNLLELGMYRAIYKNTNSRNQSGSSEINNTHKLNKKEVKKVNKELKKYKTSKYRFLKWNHRFNKYDNRCQCILYGQVRNIKLLHGFEPIRSKKKGSYEKILKINHGLRSISGLGKDVKKIKYIPNQRVFNDNMYFTALCFIKYKKNSKRHIYIDFKKYIHQKPYRIRRY